MLVQKIKVNPEDDKFYYRVKFDSYSTAMYLINGEETKIEGSSTVVFDEIPQIQNIFKRRVVKHYLKDEIVVPVEEYDEILSDLKRLGGYDSDNGCWSNIDYEYQYKKYIQDLKPEYTDVFEYRDVSLEVSDTFIIDTRDKYITSDCFLNKTKPFCRLNIPLYYKELFLSLAKEHCLEESEKPGMTYFLPTHSGLRFAKICGSYRFNEKFDSNDRTTFAGTYEQCVEKKESIRANVTDIFETAIRAYKGKLNMSSSEILDKLQQIKVSIDGLSVKMSSQSQYNNLKRQVESLIKGL